jgi:hypothetical protein
MEIFIYDGKHIILPKRNVRRLLAQAERQWYQRFDFKDTARGVHELGFGSNDAPIRD